MGDKVNRIAKSELTLAVLAWPGVATAQVFDLGEIVVLPLATLTEEARTGATVEVLDADELAEGGTPLSPKELRACLG